jgi:hypothetical protein
MPTVNIDDMLKAQQWERCKGELRAFVAMQGSYTSTSGVEYHEIERRVNTFIDDIEDDGLHE